MVLGTGHTLAPREHQRNHDICTRVGRASNTEALVGDGKAALQKVVRKDDGVSVYHIALTEHMSLRRVRDV